MRWGTFTAALMIMALAAGTGCLGGAAEEALKKNLPGVVTEVVIEDEMVVATCVNKEVVKVERQKLDPESPGGASPEGIARVAQEIQVGCEAPAVEAMKEARELKRYADACKKQKVKCKGDVDAMREQLCEKLAADLPLRGERRDRGITSNAKNWACGDPGPPKLGPNGYWELEKSGRGRARTVSAKLDSDPDEEGRFARLTIRCQGKKAELYVAETFSLKKSKTLGGEADGKAITWKVAMSTDRKAVFAKDPKAAVATLKGKKQLTLNLIDDDKKTVARLFPIEGVENAVKKLSRKCRL